MLGNFSCFCCRLLIFSKLTFSKSSFRHTITVSNSLDPDQDRHSVGPDLNPNCLRRLSADDKARKELGLCIRPTRTFRSALSVFPISLQMIVGCANTMIRPKKKNMCVYYLMKISNRVGRLIFFFLFFFFKFEIG